MLLSNYSYQSAMLKVRLQIDTNLMHLFQLLIM